MTFRLRALMRQYTTVHKEPMNVWFDVPLGPPDAILGITQAFKADTHSQKVDLGVGAYRDDFGKPVVLDSVRRAEQILIDKKMDKEYAGIAGVADFTKSAALLAYGQDSPSISESRLSVMQSISGTGALRIGAAFLNRFYPGPKTVFLPTPTWGNHGPIMRDSGLSIANYRYFDKTTNGLDFEGMQEDLKSAPDGSIILLHTCAHNPTGVDPKPDQWKALSEIIKVIRKPFLINIFSSLVQRSFYLFRYGISRICQWRSQ